jgi:hypothetical protein
MTKTISKAQAKRDSVQFASDYLHGLGISENDTIWTITQYKGNAGTALVRAYFVKNGEPLNLTGFIGQVSAQTLVNHGGQTWIRTGGGGYSRSQHVTDSLSWHLFGIGQKLKDRDL